MSRATLASLGVVAALAGIALQAGTAGAQAPHEGPGGPILVVSGDSNAFGRYYAEILRNEGLNEFDAADISDLDAPTLDAHDVVILGETPVSAAQAQMLSDWVDAGGNLIAMRPDPSLAGLLGLTDTGNTLANAYLQVDTSGSPGAGIAGQTMQFHGTADLYAPNDAEVVATLFSDATTPTANPALTLRSVGSNGGQAAAFTYDLARSVVYTRQGNPDWAGQERDGESGPIRPDDLFFGNALGDEQADWVDLDKVAIPQADEQQRLLANLIGEMNRDRMPLPRFWYFPRSEKAVVVMTGDDHSSGGTAGRFDQYKALSPPGCSVADWECIRSSSYIYPGTPISAAQAEGYNADGFEIGLHPNTGCGNWTPAELDEYYDDQLAALASEHPGLPGPVSSRTHCIAWSDWASQAKVERDHGIRLDTNYYYWPGSWIQDRPGLMTGSAMPMRFADLDGTMIDAYQAATQMTDESGQSFPFTDRLAPRPGDRERGLLRGLRREHAHGQPFLERVGRDRVLRALTGRPDRLRPAAARMDRRAQRVLVRLPRLERERPQLHDRRRPGANGLRAMVPTSSAVGALTGVTRDGTPIATTTETIKGVQYAFFSATPGDYEASYAVDDTAPLISDVTATADGDGTATVAWETNEPSDSRVDYGTGPGSLGSSEGSASLVTSHSVELNGLQPNATYHYRVTSEDEAGNSATEPPGGAPLSFSTPSASLTDTTVADFSAGAPGADTYVSETANGEVMLRPAVGAEFAGGPALPAGWSGATWESQGGGAGGTAAVSGGSLHVNGAFASTDTTFGPGSSLEGVATFGAATFQHVALTDNFESVWAMFSTRGTTNQLFASTQFGSGVTDTPIPGSLVGSSHRYRIEWDLTEVRYFVDGSLVATHTGTFGPALRAAASDFTAGGPELAVDWMRVGPYPASGAFESRIFDAGQAVNWNQLSWIENTPAGTDVQLSVRTGNTPTPDGSWSSFAPIATSGGSIGGNSRYLQYRAELSTTDPSRTPELTEVSASYTAGVDTTPPTIVQRSPAPGATGVARGADVHVEFSEPMSPATIDETSVRLRRQGAGADVAADVSYAGATATLDPVADLTAGAVYEVTVEDTVEDANGNALGADDTWTFTVAPLSLTDTTVADFSAGAPGADTYVSETANGEVMLRPAVGAEFAGGPALPAGWSGATWESQGGGAGGTAAVSGGSLHVNGAFASTDTTFGPGSSLEGVATFGAATFQHVALTDNFESVWAMFSTRGTTNQLFASTQFGSGVTDTPIPGSLVGSSHRYRIEWDLTEVRYFVDGSLVATHTGTFGPALRAAASDFTAGGPELAVDWMRVGPYPASGAFESRIFDAGQAVNWNQLSWIENTPAGTDIQLSVRTGNTPTPDGSWSSFAPIATSGGSIGGNSRYLQYRAELSTTDPSRRRS